MPSRPDFRNCVHQGIAGPSPDHILASIRAEYCLPPASLPPAPSPAARRKRSEPVPQLEDFAALARALGAEAFRQLTKDLLRQRDPRGTLARLPDFLSQHRYGRATPALVDLARLDRAVAQTERAPALQSIGACCLPPALLRAHPDLALAIHPAWHWLDLSYPVDRWRAALLAGAGTAPVPAARPVRLRVHPSRGAIAVRRLTARDHAFELALRRGDTLRQAATRADKVGGGQIGTEGSPPRDPVDYLHDLVMAGAITGVSLHPVADAAPDASASPTQEEEVTS